MSTASKLDPTIQADKDARRALIRSIRARRVTNFQQASLRDALADGLERIHKSPRLTNATQHKLFVQFAKEFTSGSTKPSPAGALPR